MNSLVYNFRMLSIASFIYFVIALFTLLIVLSAIFNFDHSFFLGNIFGNVYELVFGFLVLIFFAIFVANIFLTNKKRELFIKETQNDSSKENRSKFLVTINVFIWINMLIAGASFLYCDAVIEGTPVSDGQNFYVTYRGEFVKTITEAEYYKYSKMKAKSTIYIFTSVFLLFSGAVFTNARGEYDDLKSFLDKTQNF